MNANSKHFGLKIFAAILVAIFFMSFLGFAQVNPAYAAPSAEEEIPLAPNGEASYDSGTLCSKPTMTGREDCPRSNDGSVEVPKGTVKIDMTVTVSDPDGDAVRQAAVDLTVTGFDALRMEPGSEPVSKSISADYPNGGTLAINTSVCDGWCGTVQVKIAFTFWKIKPATYSINPAADCNTGKADLTTDTPGTFTWSLEENGNVRESGSEHVDANTAKSFAWNLNTYGPNPVKAYAKFVPDRSDLQPVEKTFSESLTCGNPPSEETPEPGPTPEPSPSYCVTHITLENRDFEAGNSNIHHYTVDEARTGMGGPTNVTKNLPQNRFYGDPATSPDACDDVLTDSDKVDDSNAILRTLGAGIIYYNNQPVHGSQPDWGKYYEIAFRDPDGWIKITDRGGSFMRDLKVRGSWPHFAADGDTLFYLDEDNRLSMINHSGSQYGQAKIDFVCDSGPKWSPDSSEVSCQHNGVETTINLPTMKARVLNTWSLDLSQDPAGTKASMIIENNMDQPFRAWFSRDITKLAPVTMPMGNVTFVALRQNVFDAVSRLGMQQLKDTQLEKQDNRLSDWEDPAHRIQGYSSAYVLSLVKTKQDPTTGMASVDTSSIPAHNAILMARAYDNALAALANNPDQPALAADTTSTLPDVAAAQPEPASTAVAVTTPAPSTNSGWLMSILHAFNRINWDAFKVFLPDLPVFLAAISCILSGITLLVVALQNIGINKKLNSILNKQ